MQLKRTFTMLCFAILGAAVVFSASSFAQTEQQAGSKEASASDTTHQSMATTNLKLDVRLTTGVMERMPVDSLANNATVTADSVFFWTRVHGVAADDSTSITHIWQLNGDTVFTRELPVKGPTWRTWTFNAIGPQQTGEWKVMAIGPDGTELASMQFTAAGSQPGETQEQQMKSDTTGATGSETGGY